MDPLTLIALIQAARKVIDTAVVAAQARNGFTVAQRRLIREAAGVSDTNWDSEVAAARARLEGN